MSMSPIGRDVFNVTLTITQESILVPKSGSSLWLQFLVLLGLEQKVRPELLFTLLRDVDDVAQVWFTQMAS